MAPTTGIFENAIEVDRMLRAQGYDVGGSLTLAFLGWVFRGVASGVGVAADFCQKRYQIHHRRGRYWDEKRLEDAKDEFVRTIHELAARYDAGEIALAENDRLYHAAANRFAAVRETVRREGEERTCAEAGARMRPPPWLAPRALAHRGRIRDRIERSWSRWVSAARDAVVRGFAPPPAPGARRRAGAPVRRLCRSSVNPVPPIERVVEAFRAARGRGRVAEKIRCGSLLLDAEAGVDSSLRRTETGEITGRNPGLRGWIGDRAPWLLNHYASLMQYRRLAQAFREAHGLRDPHPASILLDDDAPRLFPAPRRARLEEARKAAKESLASAGRTMKDLRQALARREWRRTG